MKGQINIQPSVTERLNIKLSTLSKHPYWLIISIFLLLVIYGFTFLPSTNSPNIREVLRQQIFELQHLDSTARQAHTLYNIDEIVRFYTQRQHVPVWALGTYIPQRSVDFVECILSTQYNGLLPDDYHLKALQRMLATTAGQAIPPPTDSLVQLELLFTDAYLLMASHYVNGKIDPMDIEVEWHTPKRRVDVVAHFQEVSQAEDLCASLNTLLPTYSGYQQMQTALRTYQNKNWSDLPLSNRVYQKGMRDPFVVQLRERLQVTGELAPGSISDYFDSDVEKAVMRFQHRHGLHMDGLVRNNTVQVMNVNAQERRKQITANLERWRWMPKNLGTDYILVNVPAYDMRVIADGKLTYNEKVIVGRGQYPTPSFSDTMTYVVLNPYWNIPQSIVKNELLFQVQADPNYLINSDIKIFRGNKEVSPSTIDWKTVDTDRYYFRQGASAFNPLGIVKFIFPNKHNIYIHDTPDKHLFNNSYRSYSHGCVRLKDPLNFAQYLLSTVSADWDSTRIQQVLFSQKETKVDLTKPIPIHLLYWTAFVDETGVLNFRDDLYKWDDNLYNALTTHINDFVAHQE